MCNSPTPFLAGSDIVAELANIDWEGYTGTLRYNAQRAREKDTLSYTLVQIQPIEVNATTMRLTVTPTSFLGSTETNETNTSNTTTRVWQSIRPFVYADGTTKVPSDVQPLEVVVDVTDAELHVTGFVVGGVSVAFSLYCLAWTYRNRHEAVIRGSQTSFLSLICAGTMLQSLIFVMIWLSGPNDGPYCMAIPWTFFIGYAVTYSGLYAKTWKLRQVCRATNTEHARILSIANLKR